MMDRVLILFIPIHILVPDLSFIFLSLGMVSIKMQIYALFFHPKNVSLLLLSVSFEPVVKLFI